MKWQIHRASFPSLKLFLKEIRLTSCWEVGVECTLLLIQCKAIGFAEIVIVSVARPGHRTNNINDMDGLTSNDNPRLCQTETPHAPPHHTHGWFSTWQQKKCAKLILKSFCWTYFFLIKSLVSGMILAKDCCKKLLHKPSSQEMRVHQRWKDMWICPSHSNINTINSHTACHFCRQSLTAPHPSDCFFKQSTLPKTICAASSHFNEKHRSQEKQQPSQDLRIESIVFLQPRRKLLMCQPSENSSQKIFLKNVCTSLHCILRNSCNIICFFGLNLLPSQLVK